MNSNAFIYIYNTKIIILPGGLTPKAQIMDTHNNRPFKANLKAKLRKLRLDKYNAAKAQAARDPLHKGRVAIPKLTREEVVDAMLDAWEELDPNLGANAWEVVKLMPYELAQEKGWTPKEAFADIRHLDWPWQMVSNIKPKDAGSDIEAFEWDNVPESNYDGTVTPSQVRAQMQVNAVPDHQSEEGNQTGSSQTETESIVVNSTPALQTPSLSKLQKACSHFQICSTTQDTLFKGRVPVSR